MVAPDIWRGIPFLAERLNGGPMSGDLPITPDFHPDAPWQGRLTIEALRDEGFYRSQFEKGTGNGGPTARPGGDRWVQESRMFGSAYDNADPALRPRYGALNYEKPQIEGSPRFGSSHLRLRSHVLSRTTFCYLDSALHPVHFGVQDRVGLVALAEQNKNSMDILDDRIEAQVHGRLSLADDVDALVLDASYRGTRVEAAAAALPCAVGWHAGFRMSESRVSKVARGGACGACRVVDGRW